MLGLWGISPLPYSLLLVRAVYICFVLFLCVEDALMCTTGAELISTKANQECATVRKCHQKNFVLVLEQRKKKQFGCCNAIESGSHGGTLNHDEARLSVSFFFPSLLSSHSKASPREREKMSWRKLGIVLVRLKTLHLHPHSFFRDKVSLRISQIAFHFLCWIWLGWS